jgi:hypothetical protein
MITRSDYVLSSRNFIAFHIPKTKEDLGASTVSPTCRATPCSLSDCSMSISTCQIPGHYGNRHHAHRTQDQNVKSQSTSNIMSRSIHDLTLSMKTMESVFDDYRRDLCSGTNLEISTPLDTSSTATSVAESEVLLDANGSTNPTGESPADRALEGQGKIIPSKEQIQAVFRCQYRAIQYLRQNNFSVGWWDTYQKGVAAAREQVAGWEDLERIQTLYNLYGQ